MEQKNVPLPKTELKRQIKRFLQDKDRGISIPFLLTSVACLLPISGMFS